jgi:hypothetical protein
VLNPNVRKVPPDDLYLTFGGFLLVSQKYIFFGGGALMRKTIIESGGGFALLSKGIMSAWFI